MTPSPERSELTAALRELKRRTGLSLTRLEERTPFSKSSWGRYLKGETLPPREAVRELCRLAGEPEGHCLALWELAESETRGRAAPAPAETPREPPAQPSPAPSPAPAPEPAPEDPAVPPHKPTRHGSRRIAAVTAAVLTAALASAVTAVLVLSGDPAPETPRAPTPPPVTPPADPRCRDAACEARDPMNMRCGSGTRTLATHRTATGAHLELRHNPRCGASWARMWSTEVGDRLEMTAAGPTHSAEVVDALDARNYLYTPMTTTDPGTVVRACFRPASKAPRECFEATVR
ncbi:DUF2690 domain-containing protein [Streptomyces sp. NPDC052012]|uniref:helix-turn-helix domain-containing protein n=1 Tax=Streptomyces sp. NPDC052012 TaxID=3155051 RepID=UPI00344BE2C5